MMLLLAKLVQETGSAPVALLGPVRTLTSTGRAGSSQFPELASMGGVSTRGLPAAGLAGLGAVVGLATARLVHILLEGID
jgi:hypothetical protein